VALPDDPLILLIGLVTPSNISWILEIQLVWLGRAKQMQLSHCLGTAGFERGRRVFALLVGFCNFYGLIYEHLETESGTL
jgi:hypothetical protein